MDALHLLSTRKSAKIPELAEPGPSREQIGQILTIASRVPDHGKLVPWRFIVLAEEGRMRAGSLLFNIFQRTSPDAPPERLEAERCRMSRVPLVIGVISSPRAHPKITPWEQQLSAGAAAMNLLLGVHALGFSGKWITDWFSYDPEARTALGILPDEQVAGWIFIGSCSPQSGDRPRPHLSDIVTWF